MKKAAIVALLISSVMYQCAPRPLRVMEADRQPFLENSVLQPSEDLSSSHFTALRNKYQLDTLFHGEQDELKRMLILRNWIKRMIIIDNIGPFPGDGSAESILDEALKGHGFHCAHFTIVQNAVMNAYGYITRCVRADEGAPDGAEGHHAVNEIWLNSYRKWFMSDAKYDYHFEKNYTPLSALEIRDEYLKNKAADITLVKGPDRIPTASYPELNNRPKELFARIYTWISWNKYNNVYTGYGKDSSNLIMYKDEYFNTHTWLRGGKPHWAYNTRYLELIGDRKEIEWTPNMVRCATITNKDSAFFTLTSSMPGWKTYQVSTTADSAWKDIPPTFQLPLNKRQEIAFRAVNIYGVCGPDHKIIIDR